RLEAADTLEQLGFSTCHRVVAGLQSLPLETWLNYHPEEIASRDVDGNTPLFMATQQSTPDIALLLIERGANVEVINYKGHTALHFALSKPHAWNLACVKALIRAGADADAIQADGSDYGLRTPLGCAVRISSVEAVALLLQGANPDPPGYAPLAQAVWHDHLGILKLLVEAGADINRLNHNGSSAIGMAVQKNHVGCVRFLRDKGCETGFQR
ncbi:MAG: hypothetical protein Q9165_000706, partial [Trypethelium subeluteriae]